MIMENSPRYRILLFARHMSWVAVIASLVGAALMFFIGAWDVIEAYGVYFGISWIVPEAIRTPHTGNIAMAELISAMDSFLFALVLIIFGYGIFHLFITNADPEKKIPLPGWARITSIKEMKTTLVHVILAILFVEFLEAVIKTDQPWLPWQGLALPGAIVLLAAALKLMHDEK